MDLKTHIKNVIRKICKRKRNDILDRWIVIKILIDIIIKPQLYTNKNKIF